MDNGRITLANEWVVFDGLLGTVLRLPKVVVRYFSVKTIHFLQMYLDSRFKNEGKGMEKLLIG